MNEILIVNDPDDPVPESRNTGDVERRDVRVWATYYKPRWDTVECFVVTTAEQLLRLVDQYAVLHTSSGYSLEEGGPSLPMIEDYSENRE